MTQMKSLMPQQSVVCMMYQMDYNAATHSCTLRTC
nr:MAG TPA: hypothetical protein [Caudoviricetes sp.]